jgi:hypothetical protein
LKTYTIIPWVSVFIKFFAITIYSKWSKFLHCTVCQRWTTRAYNKRNSCVRTLIKLFGKWSCFNGGSPCPLGMYFKLIFSLSSPKGSCWRYPNRHQTLSLHTHTHIHTDCIWLISFWNNFKVNFYIFKTKNVRKHSHSWFLSFYIWS